MAQLSRYEKYRDLRAKLQSDTGSSQYESQDLADFANRLNQIDSNNFAAPDSFSQESYSAAHARNMNDASASRPLRRTQSTRMKQEDTGSSERLSSYNDDTFDHNYLDQYIREVKKYNIEQGNAASEDTSVNILQSLNRNEHPDKAPERPYPPRRQAVSNDTTDIPFVSTGSSSVKKTDDTEKMSAVQDDAYHAQGMTREDIMAEVQNLVNGNNKPEYQIPDDDHSPFTGSDTSSKGRVTSSMSTDTFNRHLEAERNTRQQLLNETAQMRAQLDDYEDNLSEVTDKMRHTNRILNLVLVVLIVALAVILGIVIYWIVTGNGR